MPVPAITTAALTTSTVYGTGVYDILMRSMKAHLEQEYDKNRIRGPEYATVYLGSLEAVLKASMDFLLQRDKASLENQLLEARLALEAVQLQKAQQELDLLVQQELKVAEEIKVLIAQECKLRAEFDLIEENVLKTVQEKELLTWKVTTEKAQTLAAGVDADSVIGRQKALYVAQTSGFTRDAEQKVAKIMVDSWNVRRTTDEGTVADGTNKLADVYVGNAVTKLLAGVGA